MKGLTAVFRRELMSYLNTPAAYVFVAVFLFAINLFAFQVGALWSLREADLTPFFVFHPWIFMVFLPAVAMRLWAEEIRAGTLEILLTVPATTPALVLGKFLAAWAFCAIALALTFPLVLTVNFLGRPDNGVIAAGYVGCLLVAGAYLAVGAAMSAMTKNQVIAFVLAVAVCFLFAAAGSPVVTEFLSQRIPLLAEVARGVSVTERFNALTRGVIALRDVVFFASFMGFFLFVNAVVIDHRKAD